MKTKKIAFSAIIVVLTVILAYIPVTIGPVRLAVLVLIPTLVVSQSSTFYDAVFSSLVFGLMSITLAYTQPTSVVSTMFQNPLVSILPRLFIGPCVFLLNLLLSKLQSKLKLLNNKGFTYFRSVMSTAVGVLVNTSLVIIMILAIYKNKTFDSVTVNYKFVTGVLLVNFGLEISILAFITPPIAIALRKVTKIR